MSATQPTQPAFGDRSEFYDLAALADARRLADWMFSQFEDSVRGRVAEMGPGIGTFSERILDKGAQDLLLLEPSEEACRHLEGRFGSDPRVRVVSETLPGAPSMQPGTFDFVLAQNVLEHIEDDGAAAREIADSLVPGGTFGVLVPAGPRLYSALDSAYGHYRRYTREHLGEILEGGGLQVRELRSFNTLGMAGWWAKKLAKSTSLDTRSLGAYEALVRLWRPIEERVRPRWGLSLIAIAEKPQ